MDWGKLKNMSLLHTTVDTQAMLT